MSLGPVDSTGDGLPEAIKGLPPSLASLALLPDLNATRKGGVGAWWLDLPGRWRSMPAVHQLCAAFDRPGLQCGLEGTVALSFAPPAEATPEALNTYLGRCTDLAGRVGTDVDLSLGVVDEAGEDGGDDGAAAGGAAEDGGGGFLGRVLGAVLPAAAPHVRHLQLSPASGVFPARLSRHLVAPPGLAFPLLEKLVLHGETARVAMDTGDVAALAELVAPRLRVMSLLSSGSWGDPVKGAFVEESPCSTELAVLALAMGLPRPVDAEGRPTEREIYVGCEAPEGADELSYMLARAGRGGWQEITFGSLFS